MTISSFYFSVSFVQNKPEKFFGLHVRCRELDIFKIYDLLGGFFFGGIFWEIIFGRIFLGGFFWEDFFGRIFWEDFFGRNSLGGIT